MRIERANLRTDREKEFLRVYDARMKIRMEVVCIDREIARTSA